MCSGCPYSFAAADVPEPRRYDLNIATSDMDFALLTLARETRKALVIPAEGVAGKRSNAITGIYSLSEALNLMLDGSNLTGSLTDSGVIVISVSPANNNDQEREMANKAKHKGVLAGVAAAVLGGLASPVVAQEGMDEADGIAKEEEVEQLDEIIVTASRREQNILDVAATVSAYDQEFIEARNIDRVADLIRLTPGVNQSNEGSTAEGGGVVVRGVTRSSVGSAGTGVYVDDVPVSFSTLTLTPTPRTFDMARVEILRGPQGTLFGAGAMGGVVRYVTNRPNSSEFSGQLRLDGSRIDEGGDSYDFDGVVNIPVVEDKLALRIAGSIVDQAGFIDQPNVATGPERDTNERKTEGVRAMVLYTPSEQLSIELQSWVQNEEILGTISVNGDPADGLYSDPSAIGATNFNTLDFQQFAGVVKYDFESVELISSSSYFEVENLERVDLGFLQFASESTGEFLTHETRLVSAGDNRFDWTTGIFYLDSELPSLIESTFSDSNSLQERSQWAVFGELNYELVEDLEVIAGIRFYDEDGAFSGTQTSPFGPPVVGVTDYDDDGVTTKFGIRYTGIRNVNIYAIASEGFRESGPNQFVVATPGSTTPTSFESDSLWSYELGAKFAALDGRITGIFAVFYNDWEDIQYTDIDFATFAAFTANAGKAHIAGLEAFLSYEITDNLNVTINGSIMEAEADETVPNSLSSGDTIPGVVEESAAIILTYNRSLAIGQSRWDYLLTASAGYEGDIVSASQSLRSEEKWTVDLRMSLGSSKLEAALYARNILNDDTLATAFNGFGFTPRRPREVGLQLISRF